MKPKKILIYLSIPLLLFGIAIWAIPNHETDRPVKINPEAVEITMYKNANCQCCDRWSSYMQRNGYSVNVHESNKMITIKVQNKVPGEMGSCHTALVDGYVVEGHVPVEDINRLLKERPKAIGIAAPGMPASSPGMNTVLNDPYDVYLFNEKGNNRVYASH